MPSTEVRAHPRKGTRGVRAHARQRRDANGVRYFEDDSDAANHPWTPNSLLTEE